MTTLALIWSVLMFICAVIAVTGNTLVITAICKSQRLLTPSNILLCFLAVIDMYCAVSHTLNYTLTHLYVSISHPVCALLLSLPAAGCATNLWMIYVVSMDRFLAITFPFQYRAWIFKSRAVKIGIGAITSSLVLDVITFAFFINWSGSGECSVKRVITPSLTIFMTVATLIISLQLVVMYAIIFHKALQHKRGMVDGQLGKTRKVLKVTDIKALKTCLIVLGNFMLMWIPRLAIYNFITFSDDKIYQTLGALDGMFPVLTSALDPLVYALRNGDIRSGIVRLFCAGERSKTMFLSSIQPSEISLESSKTDTVTSTGI